MRESIKASQECLDRIRAGETNGAGEVGYPDTAPVERTPGVGEEKIDIGI